jgi:hypothetical protein
MKRTIHFQKELIFYLDILRASVAINNPPTPFGIDPLHAELRNLFADTETGSGSIGNSPLAIINLIGGKKDNTEPPYALARTKLFFVYLMNRCANELLKSPELCQKTNQWLFENNKGWQLELNLIKELKENASFFMFTMPLFAYGAQAIQNYTYFLRRKKSVIKIRMKDKSINENALRKSITNTLIAIWNEIK